MREVAPGDIVFSFCDTRITALGIVSGYCRESPKPEELRVGVLELLTSTWPVPCSPYNWPAQNLSISQYETLQSAEYEGYD